MDKQGSNHWIAAWIVSHGEESRHVQVVRVELGLARCNENSALVSKVQPELAQCLEYSIAHVRVPHQRLCALQCT